MKKSILFLAFFAFVLNSFSQPDTRSWTILASYTIPGKASGLAWDGQYLYSGLYSEPGNGIITVKVIHRNH